MGEATTQRKMDYFRLPRPLWRKLKKYLPKQNQKKKSQGGRPRASDRAVANAIWYVLWTGCQWKALHKDYSGSPPVSFTNVSRGGGGWASSRS